MEVAREGSRAVASGELGLDADKRPAPVRQTRILMGTMVNLTVVGDDRPVAEAAVVATLDRMAGLEAIPSRHKPGSQLSQLNCTGSLAQAAPYGFPP